MNTLSLIITSLSLTFMTFCDSNSSTNPGKIEPVVNDGSSIHSKTQDLSGCYIMVVKNDTAILKLSVEEKEVSGSLLYNRYEKDDNNGTISGTIIDSLIIADYSFQSEGLNSVRQVVFRIGRDALYQGFGEERVKGDTAVFRDVKLVIFDTKHPFLRNCY